VNVENANANHFFAALRTTKLLEVDKFNENPNAAPSPAWKISLHL
jgi:hypothetical protein